MAAIGQHNEGTFVTPLSSYIDGVPLYNGKRVYIAPLCGALVFCLCVCVCVCVCVRACVLLLLLLLFCREMRKM